MGIGGDWDVTIKTPIGTLAVRYAFAELPGGLTGTATYKGETVPLQDLISGAATEGTRLTWRQSVTKPMRLNLDFDVVVDGDRMAGHSRAGRLPRSAVSGIRR
ncbi:hypothetical protein A5750_04405 [Mycobacterium sp. 852002-51613_SCH5001154]|uniref:hypothetical protein n=1 Tax=unclassified Mycobacterium TaxID=2642494 RepID=UPI00080225F9|nr:MULTISPECIES: hypothetical protein [unclassified Mycobacterium]OBF77700.1 hypothetical protein A5750_04405 [Mycobacterium sp. 852002-51613_SCH5001154]OBF96487.1 hypothetical protein A5773_11695 [Mycobacterium sp. 852014-52450_SCH5900713]